MAPSFDRRQESKPRRLSPSPWRSSLIVMMALMVGLWLWLSLMPSLAYLTISYSDFKTFVARREVIACRVQSAEIVGEIAAASEGDSAPMPPRPQKTLREQDVPTVKFAFRTMRVEDPKLVEQLEAAGAKFVGDPPSFLSQLFWGAVLPVLLLGLLFVLLFRRQGSGPSLMGIGKSRARLAADEETNVSFADVAGCDEAKQELAEVVDFLRNPDRYRALGARIPRGVLLVGPPGTGKTLLARAVAGEAKVPFFQLSGSDFVEMFVGVGAARVRDLFNQAKQRAPSIIFIDELDAVGRQRGVHIGMVNDEREQTLNALLVEMDGFEANVGVIMLAATNRPDVLDHALLRPGRFDRQVVVDAPDIDGREAILKVHVKSKPLDPEVNLRRVAQATPGFSGADLANAVNEAALLAARRLGHTITQLDLENAVERVVAGPERKSRRLDEEEKRRVAFHEVGHALVAFHSEHSDKVHKISIVPRGRAALGYTLQLPDAEQFLLTRDQLADKIKGMLGGRAAEEIVFGQVSTGAANDLEQATDLARRMVCSFGMGDAIGLTHCGQRVNPFLPEASGQIDCSPETARKIDEEVRAMLDRGYAEAREILEQHRPELSRVAEALLVRETLDYETFQALIRSDGVAVNATTSGP